MTGRRGARIVETGLGDSFLGIDIVVKAAWAAPAALVLAGCLSAPASPAQEGALLERRIGQITPLVPRSHPRLLVLAD